MKRFAITFVGLDNCPRPNRVKFRRDVNSENRESAVIYALMLPRGKVATIKQINVRFVAL